MNNCFNDIKFIDSLKVLCDWMNINIDFPKCDLIIGCGCQNLDIPVRCAELYKTGYADKILFAGGLGKGTLGVFNKSEAEIFRDIAVKNGVPKEDILVECNSTNTGDNFRFGMEIIRKSGICAKKILIVHKPMNLRRTFNSAKKIIGNCDLYITSPKLSFDDLLNDMKRNPDIIDILLGDVQRIVIYPQFGWQVKDNVPDNVIEAYDYVKKYGFSKYIIPRENIDKIIGDYNIQINGNINYFG